MKPIRVFIGNRFRGIGRAVDLSIPLVFHGPQPSAYGAPRAEAKSYSGEGFTLDTRRGGSCNCETLSLTPHCNGTHTESVGHLSHERFPVAEIMPEAFLSATLITVQPISGRIDADAIEIVKYDMQYLEALIVRTLPNDASKASRSWDHATTPYFTVEAIEAVRNLSVQHLLVDLPSLDPLHDGGRLAAHRAFWGLPPGSQDLPHGEARLRTITEMIFVPDHVPDGRYALTIEMPRFVSDAAPSRPILYYFEDEI